MPITDLEQTAAQHDWSQERVDAAQSRIAQQEAEHFANPTPVTNELGRLAAHDRTAAQDLSLQALGDVDQDRIAAVAKHLQ